MLSPAAAAGATCCHRLGPYTAARPHLACRCLLLSRSFLSPFVVVSGAICLRFLVFLLQCHTARRLAPRSRRFSAKHTHFHTVLCDSILVLAHELAYGASHVQLLPLIYQPFVRTILTWYSGTARCRAIISASFTPASATTYPPLPSELLKRGE